MAVVEQAKSTVTSTGAKASGGLAGTLGLADLAEGNGFDRAAAAAGEIGGGAARGLNRAREMVGETLRGIFGGQMPWEMGGETADAVSTVAIHAGDAVAMVVL